MMPDLSDALLSMEHFRHSLIEHAPALRRYARALTGNFARADDLLQDCLERALNREHQYQTGTNLKAWLYTMMHHLFVDGLRSAKSGPVLVDLDAAHFDLPVVPAENGGLDDLGDAIQRLPAEQKEIVLLVSLEGWGYQDTARILDIPIGTVMSRLHRARETLRQQLFGADDDGGSP